MAAHWKKNCNSG